MKPIKIPDIDIKFPKFDFSGFELNQTCDKKDSEQAANLELLENPIKIEDTIPVQDIETMDCDKKVASKTHGPIRSFKADFKLGAPMNLPEPVNYVKVKNARTCAEFKVTAGAQPMLGEIESLIKTSGETDITLTDSQSKDLGLALHQLNVREGLNVVEITYFGKCQEYRVGKKAENDLINCQEATVLSQVTVALQVKINRVETPGTNTINTCTK